MLCRITLRVSENSTKKMDPSLSVTFKMGKPTGKELISSPMVHSMKENFVKTSQKHPMVDTNQKNSSITEPLVAISSRARERKLLSLTTSRGSTSKDLRPTADFSGLKDSIHTAMRAHSAKEESFMGRADLLNQLGFTKETFRMGSNMEQESTHSRMASFMRVTTTSTSGKEWGD